MLEILLRLSVKSLMLVTLQEKMMFECYKVIQARPDINSSAADVLKEKVLVTKASGTCIVPKEKQRG